MCAIERSLQWAPPSLSLSKSVRLALAKDQDPGAAVERTGGVIDPLGYLDIRPESSVDEAMSRTRSSSGMVAMGRYEASGVEAEFEPGSRRRVLRNHLGIRRARDMEVAESRALRVAQLAFIERFGPEHRFTARNLCDMHKVWLGSIYEWAGRYRTVDIGKGGFQFAHAGRIPDLMTELERGALHRHTPCIAGDDEQVALALAETHAELMLIHPFRDGNGRLGRLLATLMALQAGLPVLDFRPMYGKGADAYIAGIHAALSGNYRLMQAVFAMVIAAARRRDRPRV